MVLAILYNDNRPLHDFAGARRKVVFTYEVICSRRMDAVKDAIR